MPNVYEPLVLTIEPPYIGSAFSPTVDITETSDDVTVTITDSRGEHSYTVDKTDQAIADAEAAANNANQAAADVQSAVDAASTAASRANTSADNADDATTAANTAAAAATQAAEATDAAIAAANAAASTASTAAANADAATAATEAVISDAEDATAAANAAAASAVSTAEAAAAHAVDIANDAADAAEATASAAASNADAKAALANTAASAANTAASNASAEATTANTAASAANAAATTATEAAEAADVAREAIQGDLAAKADADGYYQLLTAGMADTLKSQDSETAEFMQRISDHDGGVAVQALRGNTIVEGGELVSVNVEGIAATGFNQWDEEWEVGGLSYGQPVVTTNSIRSKNFSPCFGNQTYYAKCGNYNNLYYMLIGWYDEGKNYIRGDWACGSSVTSPSNARYFKITTNTSSYVYGATYNNDICINISDTSRNGTYKPYERIVREIPPSTLFTDNLLKSAGTAYDERTPTADIRRVGVADLTNVNWTYSSAKGYFYALDVVPLSRIYGAGTTPNALILGFTPTTFNALYNNFDSAVNDSFAIGNGNPGNTNITLKATEYGSDTDALKAAMSGVMLYYELATPTTVENDPPMNMDYPTQLGGIESFVIPTGEQSAPPTLVYTLAYDADGVRDEALSVVATVEGATASTNYAIGSYFVHGGILYKATSAIATGETINPGTNCIATTVMAELIRLTV